MPGVLGAGVSQDNLTFEGVDALVTKMEGALRNVSRFQSSKVKLAGAQVDLLAHIESARDIMLYILQNPVDAERSRLTGMFGGDCILIARIRSVLDTAKQTRLGAAHGEEKEEEEEDEE